MPDILRREFLLRGLGSGLALTPALRAAAPRAASYSAQHPDMLVSFLASRLNKLAASWDQKRAAIRTPAQIEARNRVVREKFREMIHGLPERNPLGAVITGGFARQGYRVENVMFQSRPDFWVTANLYLPTSGPGPFPGILSPCGHYDLARMQPDYQFVYINLALHGFVVLAFDPVGQGERRHYWNPYTGETEVSLSAVYEHSMPGQLLLMMGEDLTHYRIWDGMRGIDYLLSRPEVDKEKIGCAGHSGGGTLTKFISALDERVRCAVINEGGTANRWPFRVRPGDRVGPSDVEQNLFPAAVHGVDSCDLQVAIAPRPLLALIEDYSPGFNQAAEHIRARYQQLGVPEKFATEEATDPHAWTVKLRLATTRWFSRWLLGKPGPEREPEFEAEPPERLYCTPLGSVRYSHQGQTLFSLIVRKQADLPPARKPPGTPAELDGFRESMRSQIRKLLRLRQQPTPLEPRLLVTTPRKRYRIEKLEFLSEPGIHIPTWVFLPETIAQPARWLLYLHESGKQAEGMEFGRLERLARQGRPVVAIDVRGVGGTLPPHQPSIREPAGFRHLFDVETAMSYMAWFMDESLFGMRVWDALRGVDYALSRPEADRSGLDVIGQGAGALWALYAAALDDRVHSAVCENCLLSYRTLAQADRYLHGASVFVRDVLLSFDLPQVAGAVAGRRLVLHSPVDAMKRPVEPAAAARAYEWTRAAFAAAGSPERFEIRS